MSTIKVVNIQHPDSVEPNLVLQTDGDTVFASGLTVSGTFDIANDLTVSGNTGIGTSSPTSKLHVVDTTTNLQLESTADSSSGKIDFIGKDASSNSYRTLTIDTSSTGEVNIETDPDNGGYSTDKSIIFKQAGSEKVRIDNNGNVGIGTSSPGVNLEISEPIGSSTPAQMKFTNEGDRGVRVGFDDHDAQPKFGVFNGDQSQEFVSIDSSGNVGIGLGNLTIDGFVGIGTSSPQSELTVRGSTPQLTLEPTSDAQTCRVQFTTTDGTIQSTIQGGGLLGTAIKFVQSSSERMRIDTSGNVGIATTNPGSTLEVNGDIGIARTVGGYTFRETVGGAERAGIISNSNNILIFNTGSANEKMRLNNGGDLLVAKTTNAVATDGIELRADGLGTFTKSSGQPLIINRNTNDGTLVSLRQNNTQEGNIAVSGGNVSYNPFLGSHWAALTDWSRPEIKIGTILETINELTDWKYAAIEVEGEQKKICYNGTAAPGDTVSVEYEGKIYEGIVELETKPKFNKHVKVKVNDTAASKAVYGVFIDWNTDSDLDGGIWNDMYVGAVGNFVIRMAAGQDPELGDLVESDGTGCGVVQDDDIIRTKTVAKITSTIPQVTYDDGSFLVTCVLYCG